MIFEPLHQYVKSFEADLFLLKWYDKMIRDGDYSNLFYDSPPLSTFMLLWDRVRLVIKLDSNGIWFAAWADPIFSGAFFNVWIAKEKRHTKACLHAMEQSLELGLSLFPLMVGITKQEKLIPEHLKLGYTLTGKLDGLWGGDDVWVLQITRESFHNREAHLILRPQSKELKKWAESCVSP